MEILNRKEIDVIVKIYGHTNVSEWTIENYSNTLIGYLGEHLKLTIEVVSNNNTRKHLVFFVKCLPRSDRWKAEQLKKLGFFQKEYIMLSRLFKNFTNKKGINKWCPTVLYTREDLFVFEDAAQTGYIMSNTLNTFDHDQMMAVVESLAKFHAQSFIYEHKKSQELKRPYRIWEDYSEYLQESDIQWRDAGRDAAIDLLIEYSTFNTKPNFAECLAMTVPLLFDKAFQLTKPNQKYRNVIVHRDLWSNNILFKKLNNGKFDALIVDFQTVLYTAPMLDLTSLIYFNTTRKYRNRYINDILIFYYDIIANELKNENIDINSICDKLSMRESFEDSLIFGITQAALIVPIIAMSVKMREELFCGEDTCKVNKLNFESRSHELIEVAREDEIYKTRVIELLDEMVEKYGIF